jgi:hypothetical protein
MGCTQGEEHMEERLTALLYILMRDKADAAAEGDTNLTTTLEPRTRANLVLSLLLRVISKCF